MSERIVGWLEIGTSLLGFVGAILVFVRVQVLQAYPFYNGVFGDQPLFLGITYTDGLELFAAIAFAGIFSLTYSHTKGVRRKKLVKATGGTLLIFGTIVAGIVYVETCLLWGDVLPGVRVWQGLPGGGGYPWGTEQVAGNTCLISTSVKGVCTFLNYNELFWLAALCVVVGLIMRSKASGLKGLEPRVAKSVTSIVSRNPDSWNPPNIHNTRRKLVPK